jgi:uncharacterized repeat protein (TIGR01451 family)
MKQPLGTRPNYDAPADWPWGDTLPQGVNITDYNLTDHWGGKWCDAEKTDDDKDDDEMCWAAAAANVLEWTGWGFVKDPVEGEMTDCDQMFEHINNHFNDTGGWAIAAWEWWFNGTGATIVPGGGNFWPKYNVSDYYHSYNGQDTLQYIDEYLSKGWGVALGVHDGTGHEITVWGIRYDKTYNKTTDPDKYYKGLWVTDSDDDKWYNTWTPPPDREPYYNVTYNSSISLWQFPTWNYNITAVEALEKNPFLQPDLAIHKTAYPEVVMAGDELFYNITVVNINTIVGGVTAYNVVVTDTLPAGVTYISDTGGCVLWGGTTYNCSLGDIIPGGSKSFIIKVRVDLNYVPTHGFTIKNTAKVDSDTRMWESRLRNNEVTVTSFVQDNVADLEITKSGPSTITTCILTEEPWFEYTLTVTNHGPSAAVNVQLEDWLPAGVRINSVTFTKGSCNAGVPGDAFRPTTCAIDSLASGASATITINVTVLKPADLSVESWILHNDARVSSDTLDLDNSNNLATKNTTIFNTCPQEPADLKVLKFVKPDTTVMAGQLINYTIIVENLGPSYAYNVSIRDEILSSGNFTLVGFNLDPDRNDGGPSYQTSPAGGLTLEFILTEPLEPKNVSIGGRWVLQITIRANETQDINDVVNVFTTTLRTFDPELSNNEAQTSIQVNDAADLKIEKTATPTYLPYPQKALAYTLTVTNNGPSTATNVIIRDWLPVEILSINSITSTKGSCNCGVPGDPSRPALCTVGTLMPGESATVSIAVTLKSSNALVHNDAGVSSDEFDPDNSNNIASVITLAGAGPPAKSSIADPSSIIAIALIASIALISSVIAMRRKKIDLLLLIRKSINSLKKTNTT